jgi:GDP-4-dehydro-6-deoxy-D-mannose reductase
VGIGEILDVLLSLARIPVRAELDPERVRTGVAPTLALDSTRFRAATGWAPRIDLRTSLRDLLDYWRVQVRQEARV